LNEKFRNNLSKICPETRKQMADEVEKIVREELSNPEG